MKKSIENSRIEKLTTPFVNLNGNSKEDLLVQLISIWNSFNEPIQLLVKSEYTHPRNAIDFNHFKKMKDEKLNVIKELRHLQTLFDDLIKGIKNE